MCGSVTTMLFVRKSRCVSSKVPAPVPCSGCFSNACQASFHQSQRLDELALMIRPGPSCAPAFVGCAVNSLNHPSGLDSTASAITPATNPTTSTASAA